MTKKEPEPKTTQPQNLTIADLLEVVSEGTNQEEIAPSTDIEFASAVCDKLFDKDNINMITSLSRKEKQAIMELMLINDIMNDGKQNNPIARLIQNTLTLNVSVNGKGRSDLVNAMAGTRDNAEKSGGVFRRYME